MGRRRRTRKGAEMQHADQRARRAEAFTENRQRIPAGLRSGGHRRPPNVIPGSCPGERQKINLSRVGLAAQVRCRGFWTTAHNIPRLVLAIVSVRTAATHPGGYASAKDLRDGFPRRSTGATRQVSADIYDQRSRHRATLHRRRQHRSPRLVASSGTACTTDRSRSSKSWRSVSTVDQAARTPEYLCDRVR